MAALVLGVVVLTVLCMFLTISTIMPLMGVYSDWFWPHWFKFAIYNSDTGTLGFLATMILNFYLLTGMARFVFRIGKKDYGVKKRGVFHLFDTIEFMFYILNSLLGLAKRAITSIILQVLFMGRLDKSLMPRKLELWDKSYVSYLGYMQLDLYYSHPIFLTAAYEMLKSVSPAAAHNGVEVNMSRYSGSSGSWLRRATTSQSSITGSTAGFKALPSTVLETNGLSAVSSAKAVDPSKHSSLSEKLHRRTRPRSSSEVEDGANLVDEDDQLEKLEGQSPGAVAADAATMAALANGTNSVIALSNNVNGAHGSEGMTAAAPPRPISGLTSSEAELAAKKAAARLSGHARQLSVDSTVCALPDETMGERLRRRRLRNRWLVVYTLIHNPFLAYDRRTVGVPTHLRPRRELIATQLLDMVDDDSAGSRPESPVDLDEPAKWTEQGWINPHTRAVIRPLDSLLGDDAGGINSNPFFSDHEHSEPATPGAGRGSSSGLPIRPSLLDLRPRGNSTSSGGSRSRLRLRVVDFDEGPGTPLSGKSPAAEDDSEA